MRDCECLMRVPHIPRTRAFQGGRHLIAYLKTWVGILRMKKWRATDLRIFRTGTSILEVYIENVL